MGESTQWKNCSLVKSTQWKNCSLVKSTQWRADFHWLKNTNENLFRRFAIVATSTHWKPEKCFYLKFSFYWIMQERFWLFSTQWQRTLNSRPHKNPPMGSRSAVLNAVLLKLVAKEKGCFHSFMIFQIRFNLLGGCFACRCFCSSASFCNFICSGIHFLAVGLEIFNAFAHCEMFPVGFSLYHASTRACKVGAPFLLIFGLSLVNLAILFTSCAVLRLRFSHYIMPVLKCPVIFQLFAM